MCSKSRIVLMAAAILLLAATAAHADVPNSMTIQGRLTDDAGVPLPSGSKQLIEVIFRWVPSWPVISKLCGCA